MDILPKVEITTSVFVEEDTGMYYDVDLFYLSYSVSADAEDAIDGHVIVEKDIVTLRVKLTRTHVAEGALAPPVHAPLFPKPIKENWWIVLTDKVMDHPVNLLMP
jgi:hypothetical protein